MSVNVRTLPISDGRLTLYLDIYIKGRRWKEYLGIYISEKPRGSIQRDEVAKLMRLAELRASERRIELERDPRPARKGDRQTVSDYCRSIMATKQTKKTQEGWLWLIQHLDSSGVGVIMFADVSVSDCRKFKEYLQGPASGLAQASQSKYFGLFRSSLRQAHLDDIIPIDLKDRIEPIARGSATKEFLRQDEFDRLLSTPVRSDLTRRAFLFSCLTGMRHSDIKALKWSNVYDMPDGSCELRYIMQKTRRAHVLPIKAPDKAGQEKQDVCQARELIGERGKSGALVFPNTPTIQSVNRVIHPWRIRAGIPKKITFHSARNTFATLALSNGVPLKVVSDYLGHSSVLQTEVYARLLEDERDRYVGRVGLSVSVS